MHQADLKSLGNPRALVDELGNGHFKGLESRVASESVEPISAMPEG